MRAARPLLWVLFFSFFLGLGQGLATAARPIDVRALHPTQMEIGYQAAEFHVTKWRDEAAQQRMTLADYAREVLAPRFRGTSLPVIIDPRGRYRNTDGHHRVTALNELTRLTGVRFEITPKVLADYRGKTFAEYATDFVGRLGRGQFTAAVEPLSPVERVRALPDRYEDLRDNTMRSALEVVFDRHGISGSLMRDYVEFRVARRLLAHGLLDELRDRGLIGPRTRVLPKRIALDDEVVEAITKRLRKPKMRRYLLSEARDDAARDQLQRLLDDL